MLHKVDNTAIKAQVPISVRYILPAWVVGVAVTIVILMMRASGLTWPWLTAVLWPGMALVEQIGYGVHDGVPNLHASILMVLINSIFYGALAFAIMLAATKR